MHTSTARRASVVVVCCTVAVMPAQSSSFRWCAAAPRTERSGGSQCGTTRASSGRGTPAAEPLLLPAPERAEQDAEERHAEHEREDAIGTEGGGVEPDVVTDAL